jgi:hypothetical protein
MTSRDTTWRKPEACGSHGSCIEIGPVDDGVLIRTRSMVAGVEHISAALFASDAEIAAHVQACKNGEYDDLCGTP